ncbi:TetR/AcrR family transcriptional regulator [Kineobactrum salinum]|uniref:TetR/AcrR family transcriptional regulator n=1 Tax=Kineobactrum salinum TaxID=2708301 RepID=A0A6C0UAG6_9GAMM|nr:TetR/AcrR family transcriptional regulator [Kineobactrum salinum]QIB66834.1 TetR/AcrR family transcriptional regulator [Kineobactrum salinum]
MSKLNSGKARYTKSTSGPESRTVASLREQQKTLTRKRLTASAAELFIKHGYQATSVNQIAKLAGTTATTFYRYYSSKADVARELQGHINVDVKKTLEQFDELEQPSHDGIRGWMDQYGEMWERMHVLCDAFWDATRSDPELAAELVPTTHRLAEAMAIVKTIPEGKQRRKFLIRFVMLYLLMDRLFYLIEVQAYDATAREMLDEFSEIFRSSLFEDIS